MTGMGFGVFGIVMVPYLIYKTVKNVSDTGLFF